MKILNREELSAMVFDSAFHIHRELGPGFLESVYETVLAKDLADRGLQIARQLPVPISFQGLKFEEGFRADLVVNDLLMVEL